MSLYDYQVSQQIAMQGWPFYSLVMAAMRQADTAPAGVIARPAIDVSPRVDRCVGCGTVQPVEHSGMGWLCVDIGSCTRRLAEGAQA